MLKRIPPDPGPGSAVSPGGRQRDPATTTTPSTAPPRPGCSSRRGLQDSKKTPLKVDIPDAFGQRRSSGVAAVGGPTA